MEYEYLDRDNRRVYQNKKNQPRGTLRFIAKRTVDGMEIKMMRKRVTSGGRVVHEALRVSLNDKDYEKFLRFIAVSAQEKSQLTPTGQPKATLGLFA